MIRTIGWQNKRFVHYVHDSLHFHPVRELARLSRDVDVRIGHHHGAALRARDTVAPCLLGAACLTVLRGLYCVVAERARKYRHKTELASVF